MKLTDFRGVFNENLADLYPKTEIDAFFFRLMSHQLKFEIVDVFTKQDFIIPTDDLQLMKSVLERLKTQEPIQYILGETEFYGLNFLVNKHTLIPRPETEELVDWIIKVSGMRHKVSGTPQTSNLKILDIGTGSGCIAISVQKNIENSEVSAIDFSEEAIKMAQKNAALNKVSVNFIQKDILSTDELPEKYDVIVSNPPYVRELEKQEIQDNVLKHEPHSALFVSDENPLLFYDKIADLTKKHLNENGLLFFEINQYLDDKMMELMNNKGFKNIELKQDLFGNPRMLKAEI